MARETEGWDGGVTILIDSSVLIHGQRQPNSEITKHLVDLLASGEAAVTGPVIAEFIQGARNRLELEFLSARIFSADFLDMDRDVWVAAGILGSWLRSVGVKLPITDVSIAATAIRYGVPLFTLDRGFDGIPELELYQPPNG